MKKFIRGVYQYNQEDCGAAVLSTILNYYGRKTTISILRNKMQYDKNGANVLSIIETAHSYGLEAEAYQGGLDELRSEVKQNNFQLPLVLHVERDNTGGHYIILKKIRNKKFKIFDPKDGHSILTEQELLKQWTGIIICFENTDKEIIWESSINLIKNRYLKILFSDKKNLMLAIFLSILVSLISLVGSWMYKIVIDDFILKNLNVSNTNYLPFQFSLLFISLILFYFFQSGIFLYKNVLISKISQLMSNKLSKSFLKHLINIPEKSLFYFETGEVLSRFQSVVQIQQSSINVILTIVTESIGIFLGAIILFSLSPLLFLYVVIIVIIYALTFLISLPFLNKLRKKFYSFYSESITELNQTMSGHSTMLMQNKNSWFLNKILKKVKSTNSQLYNLSLTESTVSTLVMLTESIGGVAILWRGSILVLNGSISLGSLIVFQSMLSFFINPVKQLVLIQNEIQNLGILIHRLNDIFAIQIEKFSLPIHKVESVENYTIKLNNIAFSYYYSKNIFENVNFEISESSKVGIIGESGSGKTSLIKLLATLYSPTKGEIYLGNKPYNQYSLNKLRETIAYVPQQPFIIEGTVLDNLLMGSHLDNKKRTLLNTIIRIFDFTHLTPNSDNNNLDMYIYENGSNLSGGQKQKIGLARAMLINPKILLLDEATSNIDSNSKNKILSYLYSLDKMTIISVSHDKSIYKYSKQFLSFKQNKIVIVDKEELTTTK
ncbi:peptidase domain-containing ABC transporter [Enterococcus sp. LJL98]